VEVGLREWVDQNAEREPVAHSTGTPRRLGLRESGVDAWSARDGSRALGSLIPRSSTIRSRGDPARFRDVRGWTLGDRDPLHDDWDPLLVENLDRLVGERRDPSARR
jgi:hypothetical protein